MQVGDAYEGMTEPSGYVINESDRMDRTFSDITVLYSNENNFIAKGIRFGKWFILKGIKEHLREDEGSIAMLRKEFDLLLGMEHPGIVSVSNLEEVEGLGTCIVMQYIDGLTLGQWLQSPRRLEQRMNIALQILGAVGYVHSKGIVHRDIKPDNIMISRIGQRSILIDFGLADTDDYAILKHPAGTTSYISPEQQTSTLPDVRNDIYSLGKVLMKLLPERRFARVFKYWENRKHRPDSVELLERRLKSAYRIGRRLPWIAMATVLIIATAILLSPSQQTHSHEQRKVQISNETIQAPPADIHQNSDIIKDELPSSKPDLKPSAPANAGSINKTTVQPSYQTTPSEPQNNETAILNGKKIREESFKEMLNGGLILLEQEWKATAVTFMDTVTDPALIPENWNMNRLNTIKNNYLRMLRLSIEGNTSNMKQYTLDISDLDEMDKSYNKQIKDYQEKWNNLRNKKISRL